MLPSRKDDTSGKAQGGRQAFAVRAQCVEQLQTAGIVVPVVHNCLGKLFSLDPPHLHVRFSIAGFPWLEWNCPLASPATGPLTILKMRR